MKFVCIDCDAQMAFEERRQPGDGTFAASFRCPRCGRAVAMLANPMETQLVGALGVQIGGRALEPAPFEQVRRTIDGRDDAFVEPAGAESAGPRPRWSPAAQARLERVPRFVRGMVMKIYGEYAGERGIEEITPEIMDRARVDLGLEGMQMSDTLERVAAGLRIKIDPALCVAFADCITVAPEAFALDSEGVVSFLEPEGVERERLIRACEACPVDALLVWDADGTALVG